MKLPRLRRLSLLVYAGAMVTGLGAVLTFGVMEVTSTPGFCGTCHVMNPYYESWKGSSHNEIACVECHISPGIQEKLKKKFEAASMVASYVTGTYGTNPWAEVDDEACLVCHQRRLLAGQEKFGDLLFDHKPHLRQLRRGKRLKCTSCHSQIVQGSHIAVTTSTCILCHFKGQQPNQGTARCTLCHQTPEHIVDPEGVGFDHSEVNRYGMECQSCHIPARPGEGRVPEERCLVCHNQQERLEKFGDSKLLHDNHVTAHKVECTNCHLEIEHVVPRPSPWREDGGTAAPAPHVEVAQGGCNACHDARHSPQRTLYAGLGGKDVEPQSDVMYQAGVRCEGCHIDHTGRSATAKAGEVSCMSCHGPGYRKIFILWSDTLAERGGALRRQLDASAPLLDRQGEPFRNAAANLELVERGRGVHNFAYSLALLDASHRQLNDARKAGGLGEVEIPWATAPFASDCLNCHMGVEAQRGRVFGRAFSHQPHVVRQGLDCLTCHRTHDERDSGLGPLKLAAADCGSCHHGEAAASDCRGCHSGVFQRTFKTESGEFAHSFHVGEMEIACEDCHGAPPAVSARADRNLCADCH